MPSLASCCSWLGCLGRPAAGLAVLLGICLAPPCLPEGKAERVTLDDLIPPNDNHRFFERTRPFNYAEKHFDLVNAVWLAEAALLAYSNPEVVKDKLSAGGLPLAEWIEGAGTQGYVASTDHFVIVAFRGTQVLKRGSSTTVPDVVMDWVSDAQIVFVPWEEGGAVHQGFKDALEDIWKGRPGKSPGMKAVLDREAGSPPQKPVWFTGHSLGAALATLGAQRYGQAAGLYTFGSPGVGDRAFAEAFKVNAYRLVNGADFVTHALKAAPYLPPRVDLPGTYEHVGQYRYVGEDSVEDQAGVFHRFYDWMRICIHGFWALPGPVEDHAPLLYVRHIRQALGG